MHMRFNRRALACAIAAPLAALAASAVVAADLEAVNSAYRSQAQLQAQALPVAPYRTAANTSTAAPQRPAAARWEVQVNDVTIAKTFERWATQAGYRLKWDAQKNFLVGAPDVFEGDFETAVANVLSSPGIRGSDYPLEVCIYANTPPLVRVTRQGEQARDCAAAQ